MTKTEMENEFQQYDTLLSKARSALEAKDYRKAVEIAESAWQHLPGMLQYERKYQGKESSSVEAIDLVLEYAPLLLDAGALDRLDALLRSQRRIEKNSGNDIASNLTMARALMWDAYQFWDDMERQPQASESGPSEAFGTDSDRWALVKMAWEKMGVISETQQDGAHRLTFSTQFRAPALGKCPSCGAVAKATKAKFLERQTCPKCGIKESFVLLTREPKADKGLLG